MARMKIFNTLEYDFTDETRQSGEAYKVLSQDRRRAVGYVCPSIRTFVEE
jgi:hypothetical protein